MDKCVLGSQVCFHNTCQEAGHLFLLAVPSKIIRTRKLRFSMNIKEGKTTIKH